MGGGCGTDSVVFGFLLRVCDAGIARSEIQTACVSRVENPLAFCHVASVVMDGIGKIKMCCTLYGNNLNRFFCF